MYGPSNWTSHLVHSEVTALLRDEKGKDSRNRDDYISRPRIMGREKTMSTGSGKMGIQDAER